jgi:hypothetical protein
VQPLTMPSPGGDQRLALDEQHTALPRPPTGERSPGAVQLVAEHPHGGNRCRGNYASVTTTARHVIRGMHALVPGLQTLVLNITLPPMNALRADLSTCGVLHAVTATLQVVSP